MAPLINEKKSIVSENGDIDLSLEANAVQSKKDVKPHPSAYRWHFFRYFFSYHILSILAIYYSTKVKWQTIAWTCFWVTVSIQGITAGAHRLWSHKAYKATAALRFFLILCHSAGNPDSIFRWARDHRVHHKYSDTDADPHNATRGLWFSHIGWLFVYKHPEVRKKGDLMYLDDLYKDPVLMFGHYHFQHIRIFTAILIPIFLPTYFWGEYWFYSWVMTHFFVQTYVSHASFTVNSISHKYGMRPYDKSYLPSHCMTSNLVTLGEGHHNYHHTFPADYSHGEFNAFKLHPYLPSLPNLTTRFIEFCSLFGLAYDLRRPSRELVKRRMARTGDHSLDDKIN